MLALDRGSEESKVTNNFSGRVNGIACGLVSSAIWGAFPVMTRFGIQHTSLDMYDVTFLRYGVSGLILLPFLLITGLKGVGWKETALIVIGIGAPYMLIVSHGLTYAPVERFAVVTPGSMIIFSVVLSAYLLRVKLTSYEFCGVAAIIAGVGLIGYKSLAHSAIEGEYAHTILVFLLGGLLWSIFTISTKAFSIEPMRATAIVSVFSAIFYSPFYLLIKKSSILHAPMHDIVAQGFYQGIMVSIVALFFYSKAISFLGPAIGSTFAALVPAAAIVLAALVLGEWPTPLSVAGLGVVTVGMILCLCGGASRPPKVGAQ